MECRHYHITEVEHYEDKSWECTKCQQKFIPAPPLGEVLKRARRDSKRIAELSESRAEILEQRNDLYAEVEEWKKHFNDADNRRSDLYCENQRLREAHERNIKEFDWCKENKSTDINWYFIADVMAERSKTALEKDTSK